MPDPTCDTCGEPVDESGVCRACATFLQTPASATALSAPRTGPASGTVRPDIPGYRILGELGEGGMGAVYVAEEASLGRRVAVKVISGRIAANAQAKARFLREARTLATVEHPHVVRVYAFGEVDGSPYLAMEYVEGDTLADRIRAAGKLPVDVALRIARDIVDALEAAWEKKIVHRDIKPQNILMDRRNRVRVADFGLAKAAADWDGEISLTGSGLIVGSPHYISPEQAQGKEADFRADFYSLGIMLWHMLTGERPFEGSSPVAIVARHLQEPVPSLRTRRPDVPATVDQLIQWLTQKDPDRRPESHAQLLATLYALIGRTPVPAGASFTAIVPPQAAPSRRLVIAATVIAAAAILAIAFFLFRRAGRNETFLTAPAQQAFVVAVAPFYGPDDLSAREGKLMASFIETEVAKKLAGLSATVLGIEETKIPIRSHEEARELGTKLHASAVIWGEAFVVKDESEIQPHVTLVTAPPSGEARVPAQTADARLLSSSRANALESLADAGGGALKLEAEAPNQIELRKMSAAGVGDIVMLLAAIHALENEKDSDKALRLLRSAPRTADTLRYEVQALLLRDRTEEARATLEQALALDPGHAPSQALLGDLLLAANRTGEAIEAYRKAAAIGKPYTSTRGIWFENRLYFKEVYRSGRYYKGAETESLYLLALDPATERVVYRQALPGIIETFRADGQSLVITYNSEQEERNIPAELRLRNGQFDRSLFPPPTLGWRMRSMRSARVIPANFLEELERVRQMGEPGGRFVLATKELAADAPKTLPELERALRAAIERDPTQPAHLFHLALTLRHMNRAAEGEAVFAELVRRDFPGIPYYDYTWMMQLTERLQLVDWSRRLSPKALAARRQLPQPAGFSTLIERLINANFVRHAAMNRVPDRGYEALTEARELTGPVPEGEDLVAALWARHFARAGAPGKAAQERAVAAAVRAHPFNYLGTAVKVDYALAVAAAAFVAFTVLLLMVVLGATVRVGRERVSADDATQLSLPMARAARTGVIAVFGSALVLAAIYFAIQDALLPLFAVVAVGVVVLLLRWAKIAPGAVFRAIPRAERRALAIACVVLLLAAGLVFDRVATLSVLERMPIGLSDAIGHPRTVREFERLLEKRPGRPALTYMTALANHYAGKRERARELYQSTGTNVTGMSNNKSAAFAGGPPAAAPAPEQLFAALGGTRFQRWRDVFASGEMPSSVPLRMLLVLTAIALLPLLVLAMFRPREAEWSREPLTRAARIAALLVPGLYDVRRGRPAAAYLLLFLGILPLLPLWSVATRPDRDLPAITPILSVSFPNIASVYPIPVDLRTERLQILRSYPYGTAFWTLLALSLVAAAVLHGARVRQVLREPGQAAAPARSMTAVADETVIR